MAVYRCFLVILVSIYDSDDGSDFAFFWGGSGVVLIRLEYYDDLFLWGFAIPFMDYSD